MKLITILSLIFLTNLTFGSDVFPIRPYPKNYFANQMSSGNYYQPEMELDETRWNFYNRTISFNVGWNSSSLKEAQVMNSYSDSADGQFKFGAIQPAYSVGMDFILGARFSLGFRGVYQQSLIQLDNVQYETKKMSFGIHPRLCVINSPKLDYYIQINVAYQYRDANRSLVSGTIKRLLPENHKVYTGVTLVGLNYKPHNNWGLNAEFSLFSYETISLGLTYRFLTRQ